MRAENSLLRWTSVLGCFRVVSGEKVWAEKVGVAGCEEGAAGPGGGVGGFGGEGEGEEVAEAGVAEGVGVD